MHSYSSEYFNVLEAKSNTGHCSKHDECVAPLPNNDLEKEHMYLGKDQYVHQQYLSYCKAPAHNNNGVSFGSGFFCWVRPNVI